MLEVGEHFQRTDASKDPACVASTRAELENGYGGCIVGWQDGDLAAAEPETWPAKPKPVLWEAGCCGGKTGPAGSLVGAIELVDE